jgi:UDPglucose--hexose-1-phosphate uridylyltransferase
MPLEFIRRSITSEFESPFENFNTVKVSGEIRVCPLSGHVTRVATFRAREFVKYDLDALIEKSKKLGCPFCPESIESKTTRFAKSFAIAGEKIRSKDTVIFPNAFPYEQYSAVAVFTKEHFLAPHQFTPAMFKQALKACQIYFQNVKRGSATVRLALINWNYMPLAGAGIVHPHLQLLATKEPLFYHRLIIESQRRYETEKGGSIFDDFVAKEQKDQQRYMYQVGFWHWIAAFAPRGLYEFWAIFNRDFDILEMGESDLSDLSLGINVILNFLEKKGVQAFNMCLYSFYKPAIKGLRSLLSIVPRVNLPPLETSDVNYFNRLHGESITFIVPEYAAREVRDYFSTMKE